MVLTIDGSMVLTIALILVAMIALAALELYLFWKLGERDDRRRRPATQNHGGMQPCPRTGAAENTPRQVARRKITSSRP